jgi:hypothetical protein
VVDPFKPRTTSELSRLGAIIHFPATFLAFSLPSRISLEMLAAETPAALAKSLVVIDAVWVAMAHPFMVRLK